MSEFKSQYKTYVLWYSPSIPRKENRRMALNHTPIILDTIVQF